MTDQYQYKDLNEYLQTSAQTTGGSYNISAGLGGFSVSGGAANPAASSSQGTGYSINAGLAGFSVGGGATNSQGGYSISSGISGFGGGGSSYEASGNDAAATQAEANAQNLAVNQIASDLLQLNRSSLSGGVSGVSGGVSNGSVSISTSLPAALSQVEAAILRSTIPIDINETEEITVNGQRGIWANKQEVVNWRGVIPLNQYVINEDTNPEVITKRSQQQIVYQQEVAIRYLRPPTPPAPGEIVITQEVNTLAPPAPPLVIRQQPPRPVTPQPLVVREAPPQPPAAVGRKVITISGKRLPPPPRKVVIERLAPLPSKPQSVIIERWLPYSQVKRRVIFQKSNEREAVLVKPRNVIIQWEAPQVQVKKEFKDLGVIRANPAEYVQRYGATLKTARELPSFVLEIKPPAGVVLAADYQYNSVYELEGDLHALRLIDLDREGLSEYRSLLQRLSITSGQSSGSVAVTGASAIATSSSSASYGGAGSLVEGNGINVITEIFNSIDRDHNGKLSREEAEKLLLRLNSRLNRRYGEDDVRAFFNRLDVNQDEQIDLTEFRRLFESQLI